MSDRRLVIVTGANSGLGKGIAEKFAELDTELVLVCRNDEKCRTTREYLEQKTGNTNIHTMTCDVSNRDSIDSFTAEFKSRFDRLDVLVNNAGIYRMKFGTTSDKYEKTFAVNFLGPFMITHQLLELLNKTENSVVIGVSSLIGQASGKLDFDFIRGEIPEKDYSGAQAYHQSKLAVVMGTSLMAEKHGEKSQFYSFCPGFVRTEIIRDNVFAKIGWKMIYPFIKSPRKAARLPLHLSTLSDRELNGKFFYKYKERKPNSLVFDHDLRDKLWSFAMDFAENAES